MKNNNQLIKEKNDFELLFLRDPIKNSRSSQYINDFIDIPIVCPICGSKDAFNSLKIKPRYYVFPYKRDYYVYRNSLKIYFCKKHSRNKLKFNISILFSVFLMSFSPFIIFIILFFFILRILLISLILSIISVGVGLFGFLYETKKENNLYLMIRKSFFFEYYPSIGVIISIKCSEWSTKFKESNNYSSVKNINYKNLTNLEISALKYKRNMNSSLKLLFITLVGIILSTSLLIGIVHVYILIIIYLSLVFVFLSIYLYEFYLNDLIQKQRSHIFQEFKLNNQL